VLFSRFERSDVLESGTTVNLEGRRVRREKQKRGCSHEMTALPLRVALACCAMLLGYLSRS